MHSPTCVPPLSLLGASAATGPLPSNRRELRRLGAVVAGIEPVRDPGVAGIGWSRPGHRTAAPAGGVRVRFAEDLVGTDPKVGVRFRALDGPPRAVTFAAAGARFFESGDRLVQGMGFRFGGGLEDVRAPRVLRTPRVFHAPRVFHGVRNVFCPGPRFAPAAGSESSAPPLAGRGVLL